MRMLSWVHFSDLHMGQMALDAWDQSAILRALLVDLDAAIGRGVIRPDFVAVTGDIAFGGQHAQYCVAQAFFDQLLSVVGLPKDRLFFVPGNHDVNRNAIGPEDIIAKSLDSREAIREIAQSDEGRGLLLRRLGEYQAFVDQYATDWPTPADRRYCYVRRMAICGHSIAVLGLNSAWLSDGKECDYGRLALGEHQVQQALSGARDADIRIALVHHPLEWLRELDRSSGKLLIDNCDLILHGHLHSSGLRAKIASGAEAVVIGAGAIRETHRRPRNYNYVQLDLAERRGLVHLRAYSDELGGYWVKDQKTYAVSDNGALAVALPKRQRRFSTDVLEEAVAARTHTTTTKLFVGEESYLRRLMAALTGLLRAASPCSLGRMPSGINDFLPTYIVPDAYRGTITSTASAGWEGGGVRWLVDGTAKDRDLQAYSALEVVANHRHVLLLGGPGSGKTAFVHYLALCLAGERLKRNGEWPFALPPNWKHGPLLPILVSLREFSSSRYCDGTSDGLWLHISDTLSRHGMEGFEPILQDRLRLRGVLMMFDGLDDAPDSARQKMRDAVARFVLEHDQPANRFVITCRSYPSQDSYDQLSLFSAFSLVPFSSQQIRTFVQLWYKQATDRGWNIAEEAHHLVSHLLDSISRLDLEPLAGNPLDLTMLASLNSASGSMPMPMPMPMPMHRAELYGRLVDVLQARWQDELRDPESFGSRGLSPEKMMMALGRVAYATQVEQQYADGSSTIREEQLRAILTDYFAASHELPRRVDCSQPVGDSAAILVRLLSQRTGFLVELGPGLFGFPHRTIQEFLAGRYLAVQPDYGRKAAVLLRRDYARSREVVLWAVEITAHIAGLTHLARNAVAAICPKGLPSFDQSISRIDSRSAVLAGEALIRIGPDALWVRKRQTSVLNRVQQWLAASAEGSELPAVERSSAADMLARLDDLLIRSNAPF